MIDRPDLTGLPQPVIDYIEHLEASILALQSSAVQNEAAASSLPADPPSELPTTQNIIVLSRDGMIKRSPRHLYARQNRGGMGNFDIVLDEDDRPAAITSGDEAEDLVVLTNFARIFRLPIQKIPETAVRQRGADIADLVPLHPKELPVSLLGGSGDHIAILTEKGFVITRNKHYLKNGAILFDRNEILSPLAACWSSGDDDLVVATRQGKAIRFAAGQVPQRGCLALRLDQGDSLLGIAATTESGGVALVTGDGKGTIRLMAGFRKNKSPGAGGKVLIKTDNLIGIVTVAEGDDLFIISDLSKMIRFRGSDIPAKTGVVQGVNCIALRSDLVAAVGVVPIGE